MSVHTPPPAGDERPVSGAAVPDIGEAFHSVSQAGRQSLDSSRDMLRAMRRLVGAEVAQARLALARAAVWLAVAVAFGASAWLLLMAALIAGLHHLGLSWLAATSISALVSLLVAATGGVLALRYFEMASFDATRRQLGQLTGRAGNEDDEDEAGSKLTLAQAQRRIARASDLLDGRRTQLRENLHQVRGTWRAAWTPLRIVLGGLGLGFAFGKLDPEKTARGWAGKVGAAPKILQTLSALSGLFAAVRAQQASDSADVAAGNAEAAAEGQPPGPTAAPPRAHGGGAPPHPAEAATELSDP